MNKQPDSRSRPARPRVDAADPAAWVSREASLRSALAELGLTLDDARVRQLLDYVGLLHKWNTVYNLTAIRDPDAMLVQHLFDSLAVIPPLLAQDDLQLEAARVADVGSGAGLPGIPLAIVFPRATVRLVDPVGKKSAFQRQCQAELALTNIMIYNGRAEAVKEIHDLVICRAFASLADFVRASDGMTGPETVLAAMKGQAPANELASLPAGLTTQVHPVRVPGLDASRHLVLIRHAADASRPVPSGVH
jgi:16S rRNA (guanine527-N7)-methyltransferase